MIHIVLAGPLEVESDAVLRSISAEHEADTAFSREVELRAGPGVSERLRAMGGLPVGAAVITPGGDLPAPFLIHVVLQSAEEPVTAKGLRTALQNGLRRAEEWGLDTVALPPLGTGAGNMDAEKSASLMVPVILDHLLKSENPRDVLIVVGTDYERDVFTQEVNSIRGQIPAQGN